MNNNEATLNPSVSIADYWELTKPKVVALIIITAITGMAFAITLTEARINPITFLAATIGIGLSALGAAVANCLLERSIDKNMQRTQKRATATGRIAVIPASIFSLSLLLLGLTILQIFTNSLTTLLTLATFVGYAFIYTLLLKPNTPQNIVIGGISGAMPPVLGWVAITGSVDYQPLLLFLIIFIWTPPHFWALALCRLEEYGKVKVPMLPVTHGTEFTRLHIFLYSIALFAVSLLPWVVAMAQYLYLFVVIFASTYFCYLAYLVWKKGEKKTCWKLFSYSGIYLLLVFVTLMIDTVFYNLL